MNVFKLTKRSLVSTTSFSKPKKKNESSVLGHVFTSFFSKKGHNFNAFFKTSFRFQDTWREDWKPQLISLLIVLRIKVSPTLWRLRETIEILVTHIKATLLPLFWHLRYVLERLFARAQTDLPPIMRKMRHKTVQVIVFLQAILLPVLKPIGRQLGILTAKTAEVLSPVLAPINKRIGLFANRTQALLAPVLTPINNKLAIYAPSVKKRFGHTNEVLFTFFATVWQLSKRQSLTTKLLGLAIVVFCSIAFIKRKEHTVENQIKYGFNFKDFHVNQSEMKKGDAVYSMLIKLGLNYHQTDSLLGIVKPNYDFEKIQIGKPYTTLISKGMQNSASYLVIETDPKRYFVFDLTTPSVKEVKREVTTREFEISGQVQTTLYNALVESGISHSLIDMVEDALKNKIDLGQCTNGDSYKLIWEEEDMEGQSTGVEKLTSVYFKGKQSNAPVYVFYFNNGIASGYYGEEGLPIHNGFMESPVNNSTITSRFNWHRKHPILGYRRPHLGTDYAAPRGTPIMSVADGVVEEARYRMGNGRYVKIKHKPPFETEYLHMSRFATGIEKGSFVKKKQIIGYVGMSGLTTGPHVCFRFWKQGKAVDHLTERFFTETDNRQFQTLIAEKKAQLDNIPVLTILK